MSAIDKLIQQALIEYHAAKDAWRNGTGTRTAVITTREYLDTLRWERDNLYSHQAAQPMQAVGA